MFRKVLVILFSIVMLVMINGCSMTRMVVRGSGDFLDGAFESLMEEEDLVIAKSAIESDLKILEAMLKADPENKRLILLAAEGFSSYALAFVQEEDPERAKKIYLRSTEYANKWLNLKYKKNLLSIDNLEQYELEVKSMPDKCLPGVFWLGFSQAMYTMLSLESVEAISNLPKVDILMQRVISIDESFYFAGAHLYYGAYYGTLPRMLGGDPDKARDHFDRQRELTGGDFLYCDILEVTSVGFGTLDEELCRKLLNRVLDFDIETAPEMRLINRVSQEQAKVLLENLEDYL